MTIREDEAIRHRIRDVHGSIVLKGTAEQLELQSDIDAGVEELAPAECWMLLRRAKIGRIGFESDGRIEILPVNYLVEGGRILFRSAPGAKMMQLARHPEVAMEVDGMRNGIAWSVVAHGLARRLAVDAEIEESGVLALRTLHPGSKNNFVEISVSEMSGRRFGIPAHGSSSWCRGFGLRGVPTTLLIEPGSARSTRA